MHSDREKDRSNPVVFKEKGNKVALLASKRAVSRTIAILGPIGTMKVLKSLKNLTLGLREKKRKSPVTGNIVSDPTEENWLDASLQVKGKLGMTPIKINQDITKPETFIDIGQGCSKSQMPALMMKTIQDIDRDRMFGKSLALEHIRRRQGGLDQPSQEAYPVTTQIKRTPIRNSNPFSPGGPSSIQVDESRPYNQTEISDIRNQYAQRGSKDAEYLCRLWEKGADTIMLTEGEMRTLKNVIENPSVLEALEILLEKSKGITRPLLDWITAAWRLAFPTLDLTTLESQARWNSWDEAMRICKKLGILYFVYHSITTPLAAPMTPAFRKILVKGAPPHLKVSLISPLQSCQTLQDAVDVVKDLKSLEGDKVYSFQAQKGPVRSTRKFKIRPFGNPYRMNIRLTNTPRSEFQRFIGRPVQPFLNQQQNTLRPRNTIRNPFLELRNPFRRGRQQQNRPNPQQGNNRQGTLGNRNQIQGIRNFRSRQNMRNRAIPGHM